MESEYLNLLSKCIHSKPRKTRNATVYSTFGHRLEHDFKDGFPLLTTKKMFFRGIVEELAWFLRGSTNVKELSDKGVHIWDKNATEDAGPVYGFQWRHFGETYLDHKTEYNGIDQIQTIIELIKTDPTSRRIFLSAWNPKDQSKMCLPPCHVSYQFYVEDDKLSIQMYQRSADVFLGLPFNIASTALLLSLVAHETDLKPAKMVICIGDAHVYENHVDAVKKQLLRQPKPFGFVDVRRKKDALWNVQLSDIVLSNYVCDNKLKAEMVA